jgi:ATP-dependent Zn protease
VLTRAAEDAKKTIVQHRDALDLLVEALLASETVERAELTTLLGPAPAPSPKAKAAGVTTLPDAEDRI